MMQLPPRMSTLSRSSPWLIQAATPPADATGPQLHAYLDALDRRDRLIATWERFFDDWDVLLCPVNLATAPPHGEQDAPTRINGNPVPPELAEATLTLSPLTGGPAITIPLAQDSGGLPIGVMLLGRRWDDERLLAIAERLAEVTGGYRRPPGY
jgi:amidase